MNNSEKRKRRHSNDPFPAYTLGPFKLLPPYQSPLPRSPSPASILYPPLLLLRSSRKLRKTPGPSGTSSQFKEFWRLTVSHTLGNAILLSDSRSPSSVLYPSSIEYWVFLFFAGSPGHSSTTFPCPLALSHSPGVPMKSPSCFFPLGLLRPPQPRTTVGGCKI